MSSGAKDIQLFELKDTILQLNRTISEQNSLIQSLQKMLEERTNSDAKKDQTIADLQAQLEFLKQKIFGSTSELRKSGFPGQLSLFDDPGEEKAPEQVEPEFIEVKGYTKKRKPKATYDEMFANLCFASKKSENCKQKWRKLHLRFGENCSRSGRAFQPCHD